MAGTEESEQSSKDSRDLEDDVYAKPNFILDCMWFSSNSAWVEDVSTDLKK